MTSTRSNAVQMGSGLALAAAIAAVAMWGATAPVMQHFGLSALTLAIVIGIALGNTVFPRIAPWSAGGVDFSKARLLRLGVILYGFRITFQQIGDIGWAGVLIDVLVIAATFTLAVQLGTRVFGLDRQTAMLIGAGSSICGAAAVMATEPVVRGQAHKVSVAVATVVVFGTLGMFVYPLLYPYLHLSEAAYGLYAGSTIHEVAQVVVAGKAVGEQAASAAVIEKMLRVMMLAPFLVILSSRIGSEGDAGAGSGRGKIAIPWFAVLFVVASGVNSLHLLAPALVDWIVQADTVLLAMAMGALGLRTHGGAIRQAGLKPILLASVLFLFLMTGGYVINRVVTAIF
jgi:uncharacterized integral membrane protein (TIGR00698 family)